MMGDDGTVGCCGAQVNLSQFPRATLGYEKLREKFPAAPLTYDGSVSSGPTLSDEGFDLLKRLLHHDPSLRITAEEAKNHKWCAVPSPRFAFPCLPSNGAFSIVFVPQLRQIVQESVRQGSPPWRVQGCDSVGYTQLEVCWHWGLGSPTMQAFPL